MTAVISPLSRILVTGGGGFIGRPLCARLALDGFDVRASVRQRPLLNVANVECVRVELTPETDWSRYLAGVDSIVHVAARAHMTRDRAEDPLAEFRRVNAASTLCLARQAAAAGVRRFVFLSSIGVNGAETGERPFSELDPAKPHSPYALSKHEAELGLRDIAENTGMAVVVIRPPLVYGPGAPGNFGALVRAVARKWPLPLGSIKNRRSFIGVDNLVDFICTCLQHPRAANETFLVSDGEDVSTPELIRRLAAAMHRPARLIPVPVVALRSVAGMFGRREAVQALCGSLQVNIGKARRTLGWVPALTLEEGLRRAVRGAQ